MGELNQQKFEIILKYNFGVLVFLTLAIANTSSMNKVNLLLILTLFLIGVRKWNPIISFCLYHCVVY